MRWQKLTNTPLFVSLIGVDELVKELGVDLHHGLEYVVDQRHDRPTSQKIAPIHSLSELTYYEHIDQLFEAIRQVTHNNSRHKKIKRTTLVSTREKKPTMEPLNKGHFGTSHFVLC